MTLRRSFTIDLEPRPSPRFQPTGFPDLGAARFEAWDPETGTWVDCVLVESPQSMANRLEAVGWIVAGDQSRPEPALEALPYVRVEAEDGSFLASSRTEAHRLASAYILDATANGSTMRDELPDRLGLREDRPLDHADFAQRLFKIDPLCLLHGVFFAQQQWTAQPKMARAVTSVIDAVDVREAHSGGVKFDQVSNKLREPGKTAEGYGTVPHHRVEYTARSILLRWSLDLGQLRSYRLSDAATELLKMVAYWELASLLERGLRLRTFCDFDVSTDPVVDEAGEPLGEPGQYAEQISQLVAGTPELDGVDPVWTVVWASKAKKKAKQAT
ncbi:type I-G CRISPR-associated RAMP protein Csb1/Cas7g [Rhabdothermincola sediminis]|uniref:type I-G CRISPR-associated RAMP protein Csb1/Cas7g n=1 Tax=Rhabdothermincola sediminis TaxID=2751370 RepID=UPI001AA07B93|nr:type I-U CRISPR-associated RAMP protein Csb1/Cas7u [Rhabdothermincola sediminis]